MLLSAPVSIRIGKRAVGDGCPVLCVAELSANHRQDYAVAEQLVRAAHAAGADAVKLQTYTADTITLRSDQPCFRIRGGTLWDGRTLYELYEEAYTPWEWQPKLKHLANELGIELFSSAFDASAVEFLEGMDVPCHKVASFELVDIPLIEAMARTGKPLLLSTGMATRDEIDEAVNAARGAGAREIILLKCTSAYPAPPDEIDLQTIRDMATRYSCPVGISDHTLGVSVSVAAVALGACVVEKHFTLARSAGGPDSSFSLEPAEFKEMVTAVRTVERALGGTRYGAAAHEVAGRALRRSLFAVEPVRQGERFTPKNVRSIRPADGLHPRHLAEVLAGYAACDIAPGTPLSWKLVARADTAGAK